MIILEKDAKTSPDHGTIPSERTIEQLLESCFILLDKSMVHLLPSLRMGWGYDGPREIRSWRYSRSVCIWFATFFQEKQCA